MDNLRIQGGARLEGTVRISGAKNAALPILCAALLADGDHRFRNVPQLRDVRTMAKLLRHLGLDASQDGNVVDVVSRRIPEPVAPYELVKQMRASVLVLGPLVARYGRASVSLPGGCAIGARPIDQHLKGLEAMGAEVELKHGYVHVEVPAGRLKGAEIVLDMPTVTGTENLLSAAVLAQGRTTLVNAAREPEIEELARVLNKMGADVEGAGTDVITVQGVESLQPVDHAIIPDRIEAGTYMAAAAATRGNVLLEGVTFEHLEAVAAKMRHAGVAVEREGDGIRVAAEGELRATDITTAPHPGFPTDMQAQFMVLMCTATGQSRITETIFENRFMHVPELNRMGAEIDVDGRTATVKGVESMEGAQVMATDLRASASLVIAGLVAHGTTDVLRVYHIDRGYERIEEKFAALGATIERVPGHA
ncbi:MAG TPA: UDP-N-acetylglucosamine 1-carboxyvinyltransferase [Polyangiaceae bacterium LLY-WYZ-15_(1-7)]|nr:UDP-N-acetylglucosamine 1-carboxyvinyltransferase [Sandaracinus sp.]HJK90518.1 UDP-N-acetylglucosamine 1-carboxyvinyltransferase [Polyangiaceae bacterium LLY-WYZ-15_(1-7)]MBJ74632.1 UDP-N-acetylglucosamine 1-carboxyvinyltransferase [Sandaracinus sp.]HJL02010.1 UDP-N-acetylglucosamine 1-carboxyvinyltransferase [Polyangiaceae bacterium LLY-WYZ-15_(1-7)]HJL13110.1 UDP-N-acetylglucosamine 1-carboxyvinyltransferase [Polyangiaceae bacterium LLY-WYZ-15_(1-7)]